ncbi:MAG: outer membrane protein assembly factor BamA, partial [Desulfobacteraceae bacterium]|nr:outer membrane protein assembly factor BamA [Desulfobacteraceae bacterium]
MTQRTQKDWIKITALLWILMICFVKDAASAQKKKTDESGPMVSRITVDVQGIKGDAGRWVDLTKNLIFIEEGELFSTKRFQDSLEALKSSNIFKAIHVSESEQGAERLILRFQVTPYPRVKDIKVSGGFPLLEREILNGMQLRPGDIYDPEKFSEKTDGIVRLFKKEGYIAPVVDLKAAEDSADGNFVVYIHIDKGDFFHIRRFEIKGNRAFSNTRLQLRIKTFKSWIIPDFLRRFKEKEFDKDIQNLIRFYRKKRYPDVVVNAVVKKDAKTQNVALLIRIDEGPRYDIQFQGNRAFWDFTLKKDLILFKEGNKEDLGLRKSIRKIKKRYLDAGYRDCRIEMKSERKQEAGRPIRKIRLLIDEGPQYVVTSLNFKGNSAFDSKKIQKQMLTRTPGIIANGAFVQETLEEDRLAITSLYLKQGYMDTTVKDEVKSPKDIKDRKQNVDITIGIEEGVQTHVRSLAIHGLTVLSESQALEAITLKKGSVFRNYMIRSDENTLSSLISEKGYPHVKIKGTAVISEDNTEAAVTYEVGEGPLVRMGQVACTGNFRTQRRVIDNELKLDPGEPFSLENFLKSQRNIRDIEAFDSVRFNTYGLKEKEDKVNLLLELEEKKPYYVQSGVGYDTERKFYGNILAGDHNLFGLNKGVWASSEISQIGYRGDLGISEPRFLGTRIKSALTIFGEKREEFNTNFGTRERGVSLSFNRRFFQKLNADLSFVYSNRKDYPRDWEPTLMDEEDRFEPREFLTISPSLIYNSMDSYIRPKKGAFSSLLLDFSKGINNSLDDFFRYRFEVRKYYTPIEKLTFALRGRVGDITPFGDDRLVTPDQLFFLGGTSTVRGFDENLLRFDSAGKGVGGLTTVLGNIEARIDLGPDFEVSFFYDIGSVRNAIVDEGSDEFRSSVGVGLHYITQIGPMGVYYGHKLNRKDQESAGRFH